MTHDFKPGDVVAFTIGGQEYHGIIDVDGRAYTTDKRARGRLAVPEKIRPLVVIDPEDREQVERLDALIDAGLSGKDSPKWAGPADILQAALRQFANPTPPKPDEPTAIGAVVECADGATWVRVHRQAINAWTRAGYGDLASYDAINAVTILSEGVQP